MNGKEFNLRISYLKADFNEIKIKSKNLNFKQKIDSLPFRSYFL